MIETMKAEAGESPDAKMGIAMLEGLMRQTMGSMMMEIDKDAVTQHSDRGSRRMTVTKMSNDGNRYTLRSADHVIR
jgi:hypothetical protein